MSPENPQSNSKEKTIQKSKENLNLKESLNLALEKLKEIINGLPNESLERKRAEHTLLSIESALKNLTKDESNEGKYAVSLEKYPGNPQETYTQYEGVPVDELIDILKSSAQGVEDKKMNELVDELYKNSEPYFEAHYTKKHGEGNDVWTKEEQNKQDLRTRYEANLISSDYRTTGSEEGNYKAAMDVLKNRRELKFTEEPEQTTKTTENNTDSKEDIENQIKKVKTELENLEKKRSALDEDDKKLRDELKEMGLSDEEIAEEMAKRASSSQEKPEEVNVVVKEKENKINLPPVPAGAAKEENKENKEQYSREQLLNAAEIFCKYNPAAYFNKTPAEQKIAQERALIELKGQHSEREITAAVNVAQKRNEMVGLKDRITRIKQEYKDASDNPSAEHSTVKAKYDQQIENIKRELRLIDNDYNPLLRELKIANLDNQLKNLEKYRDHSDFKEKVQDAELFALSMIQTEMIRYQDAKVSSNSVVNPKGWDHVKNFFKRGVEGLSKNKLFQGYAKMGRGKRMALNAAMIGAGTALWLPATVAAGASAAAFVGYKMARSLMGGTFGYFLSKKVFQPLARKAYEHDSARTTQEQQQEALNSSEMTHFEQLARNETDPTEREKILQMIADKNIELCDKYTDKIRRNKKYFITNNALGTVTAGLLGGKGAQLTADWLAGPGMLGIFPAHGGGVTKDAIPDDNPHKGGGGAVPGETPAPKGGGGGIIEPPKPAGPGAINPDDLKAATIGKGEGIEHALRRQLEMHPDKFGFKGDITNKAAVHQWSGGKADVIARSSGYIKPDGTETWVRDMGAPGPAGNPAYVLDLDSSGKPSIHEFFEGKPSGAGGFNSVYEYAHNKPSINHYTSAVDNTPEPATGVGNGDVDVIEYGDNSGIGATGTEHLGAVSDATAVGGEHVTTAGTSSGGGISSTVEQGSSSSVKLSNFDGYTIAEKEWLTHHSWLTENATAQKLPMSTLKEIDSIHTSNNNFLNEQLNKLTSSINDKQGVTEKINSVLTKGRADAFIDYPADKVNQIYQPLHKYINTLHDVTGLSPKSETLLQAGEVNTDYINRALIDAAAKGVLDKVKL